MQHVVIFPTWGCQLSCAYCSIRHSLIDRSVPSVPWEKWAEALPRCLERGSIVDVAGGEPLLYPGIVDVLAAIGNAGIRWALTTNGKARQVIAELCARHPVGGICFNVSDHSGNPEAGESIRDLRAAGWQVNVHRVNHPAAGHCLDEAQVITYQDWVGGRAVDGIRRKCSAGLLHWIADPRGDLWRCIVAVQTGQPAAGNLFTGEVRSSGRECAFGCTSCYTEDPASWCVTMEAL